LPLDVVIVDEAVQTDEEDEVRDMFLRLQNGTTLKAQEKRNAMPGTMRNFVKDERRETLTEVRKKDLEVIRAEEAAAKRAEVKKQPVDGK
jgi:hypothetical protein